jgi:hypothetical protein
VLLKIDGDMKGKFRFSTKAVEIGIDRKTIKRNISYLILRGEQEKC